MAGVDFSDIKSATAWFEEQSAKTRCAITSRAALRVMANIDLGDGPEKPDFVLRVMRAVLVTACRGANSGIKPSLDWNRLMHITAENITFSDTFERITRNILASLDNRLLAVQEAAKSAALHSVSATSSARATNFSAVSADAIIRSALAASPEVRAAMLNDSSMKRDDVYLAKVWPASGAPPAIEQNHQTFLTFLRADPAWAFWLQFYEGLWTGTFTNWPLAMEVIQIDNAEWENEAGHKHIAGLIAGIEARLVIEDLPQVEEVFATDSGLYDVRSTATDPVVLIDSIASRVRFAFDLAVSSNSCDLDELSTAATLLRHALDNCLGDPNGFEQWLRQASSLITDGLARGEFSHHATLDVLVATLNEIGLQLRADHPDVAAAAMSRTNRAVQELSDKRRLEGAQLIEDLRDEGTTGRLQTELGLSARVARDGSSALATADAFKQAGNRAGKVSLAERIKLAESSSPMAGLKITMRAESLVRYVLDLISGGGV